MPSKITPAATLARVQELHDGGNSFRKIAEILAAEGVPAAGPRSSWHHANVSWCLKEIGQRAESSATWGLSPQLRARLAAQGEEIEGLTVAGMHRLGTGIQETVDAELETIRNTTVGQTRQVEAQLQTIQAAAERQAAVVRGTLARLSVWLVVGAVAVGLVLSGVGCGVGEWMESNLKEYQDRMARAEKMVAELEKKTGGMEYVEGDRGRWLIWPEDDEPYQPDTGRWAGRWVVKLEEK